MLNKYLHLERTLGVMDVETTGLDPEKDRIIQIAITLHYKDRDPRAWTSLIDPETPIKNTGSHKITDLDIAACVKCKQARQHCSCENFTRVPKFHEIAPALAPKITDIDIMGYNVEFDIKFVRAEMKRAQIEWPWKGCVIDPLHIYRFRHGHTLSNAYKRYVDPAGFEDAHDAGVDVRATEAVLVGQLYEYQDLPRTVKELSAFCFPHPKNAVDQQGKFVWVGEDAAFNFGKWRGKLLKDPQCRQYLQWMVNAGDFTDEVKDIALSCLEGNYPVKNNDN